MWEGGAQLWVMPPLPEQRSLGIRKVDEHEHRKQANKQHCSMISASGFASRIWLEFLLWFPSIMDYKLKDEINSFFPKLLSVIVFNTAIGSKWKQKLLPGMWSIAVAELTMLFLGRLWKCLKLWAGKAIECSKLRELSCGILEDQSVARNEDGGGLAWEVSEGSRDSIKTVYVAFWIKNMWFLVLLGWRISWG